MLAFLHRVRCTSAARTRHETLPEAPAPARPILGVARSAALAGFAAALLTAPRLQAGEVGGEIPLPQVPVVAGDPLPAPPADSESERTEGIDGGAGTRVPVQLDDAVPLPGERVVVPGPQGDVVVAAASGDPYFLGFAAGEYRPAPGESIDPEMGVALMNLGRDQRPALAPFGQPVYGFVMLKKRLTPERLQELEGLGMRGLGMHPHYAIRAAIAPEAIPAIAAHDAVRWVGVARPWQKAHPHLVEVLKARADTADVPLVVSVFESDLGEASIATPSGVATMGGPDVPTVAAPQLDGAGVRWMSNGWQQRALEELGAVVSEYEPAPRSFRLTLPAERLPDLLALDFVQFIEAQLQDRGYHDESMPMINADETREEYGGEVSHKSLAGIIDSGVDVAHTALNHFWWWAWDESVNSTGATNDLCGHGSHVAGTILGEPTSSSLQYRGAAPDLGTWQGGRFRIVKYLDLTTSGKCSGTTSHSTLYSHMRGTVNDGTVTSAPPQVINNSWGNSDGFWFGTESNAVTLDDEVWNYDQVYVFSAGNDGPATGTIGLPAVAKNALTVGAVVDFDDSVVGPPGTLADFSSKGPCKDGRWKPNVVAPGRWIRSVNAGTSTGYTDKNGTSMAAPHVTGVVAQLVDHHSFLRSAPHRLISLLQASAITKNDQTISTPSDSHLDSYGTGLISAYKAHYGDADWGWTNWGFAADFSGYDYADFTVGAGATRLVVCMSYMEPGSSVGASQAVVSDFDLWIDSPPIDTSAGNTGEYSAQQSSVNNHEIRIINNPAVGTWRWKVYPDSVSIFSSARVGVTVFVIYGDTTPNANLTVSANDQYVKPGESVGITATAWPSDYLGSSVFLDTSATSTPSFTGATVVLKDSITANLLTNQHGGDDLLLGEILDSSSRSASWTVNWPTEGVKSFAVTASSDNMIGKTVDVSVTVDGTDPSLVTNLGSTNHVTNVWSNNASITYAWTAATDALSGVDGYGISTSFGGPSAPADAKDISAVTSFSEVLSSNSTGYYFNIKTVDRSGNWTNSYASTGPYLIDTVDPGLAANLISTTHTPNVWSKNTGISFKWTAATDAHSGLDGYGVSDSLGAPSIPGAVKDIGLVTTFSEVVGSSASGRYFNLRSVDKASNWDDEYLSTGPYLIDAVLPSGPVTVASSTHPLNQWTTSTSVTMNWSAATDAHSGLAGYDTLFDHAAGTVLPGTIDTSAALTSKSFTVGSSATAWYFHIAPVDNAGNVGPTKHYGPFSIDASGPTAPGSLTSSHGVGVWSKVAVVNMKWAASSDPISGVVGYDYSFDQLAGGVPDGVVDVGAAVTSINQLLTSSVNGYYFHIRAKDLAGNFSAVSTYGPILIDTVAPVGPSNLASPSHTVNVLSSNPNVQVTWTAAVDVHSGLVGYDTEWDHSATTDPVGVVDTPAVVTSLTTPLAPSTQGWFFHIRARDNAGNLGTTRHLGPFKIGVCGIQATNTLYGVGKPGINGVPKLVALNLPIVGEQSTIEIQNGRPGATPILILGAAQTSIPFDGGTLLASLNIVINIPVPLDGSGSLAISGNIPADPNLCGVTLYHQVLIPDPAATGFYHLSMTAGLARRFGS